MRSPPLLNLDGAVFCVAAWRSQGGEWRSPGGPGWSRVGRGRLRVGQGGEWTSATGLLVNSQLALMTSLYSGTKLPGYTVR